MFGTLNKDSKRLYSFGQISEIENGIYTISYKETNVSIKTSNNFNLGDWVLLYGKFKKGVLHVRFIEKITSVNIQLLERIALFLQENQ